MNTILKKLISGVLAVVLMFSCLPVAAIAATTSSENEDSVELNDGYISVSVSKQNGGFLVDTMLGNQLKESDDDKNLLFPSAGYDTSFTSFQVTRTDGSVEEYVFGRKYGFLGLASTDVKTVTQGSSVISTWGVNDLTIVQTLSLVDETNTQHGLVDISYDVTTTADNVENVKARIMLDTALGSQDYGFYQLHSKNGGYDLICEEAVIPDAYDNVLTAIVKDGSSPVSAYTVNAVVDGVEQKPYQVAFGHWANLANTVFGFVADEKQPRFDSPYDGKYLTADSAYALYYDMGKIGKGETANVSTYYGVYSNVSVGENERVAINFTQLPSPMVVKDGSTLEKASYHGQVEGGYDGDVEVRLLIENLTDKMLTDMTVVVKTMNNVYTYTGNYPEEADKLDGAYQIKKDRVAAGDSLAMNLFFNVTPLNYSEYRYFEIEVYAGAISETNLLGSNGFYLLCPSVLGEEVSFNTTNPQTIYVEGSRSLHISGENFRLLQDTSDYIAYLRPVGEEIPKTRAGVPSSAVIPGTNIVVNNGENTMSVLVENDLEPGVYELVLDWEEDGKADTTSRMLLVHVSDDPAYKTSNYGIVTIERAPDYSEESEDKMKYQVGVYRTEAEYKATWEKYKQESKRNIYEDVLLEFRGDFRMSVDPETGDLSFTATSVLNSDGSVSGSINISNAIEVKAGKKSAYVTLTVKNPGKEDQCINIDIDGLVRTSGANTQVWDGVCAITPISNGEINQLVQYYEDGQVDNSIENTTALVNTISLLWPGAASTAQTICGMFFELRYCEFGTIATEYCDKNIPIPDDVERHRVVSFSAIIDPSFLLPTDFLMGERELNNMELAQRTLAKKNYTSSQLVEIDKKYKSDMKKWMGAQGGTLVLAVENILFGDNRFIGFDAELEVGIPSYFKGIGGIEGTLMLAVWLLDPADTVFMKFGVDGAIDLEIVTVEATLVLKSIHGVPIPDELYLYVGGITPGWNVDGCGVLWVTGLGGGFANLYDTIVSKSKVPAFSVSMEGGFSLFQILFARLKLTLSARGFKAEMKGLGFNRSYTSSSNMPGSGMHGDADILTIIPNMNVGIYWYPKFQASAGIEVNILSIIEGGGYVILEENTESGETFFEALATCVVQTPNIPLIGRIKLGGVDVGVDMERVFGALHIMKLDMGVCYYYGGDIDFSFGKYDVPAPTLLSMKVGELSDGEPVYLAFGTNISQVASSEGKVVSLSGVTRLDYDVPEIISATDRMHHAFTLGKFEDGDMALSITYPADTVEDARAVAMGGLFSEGLALTNEAGEEYELQWLDTTGDYTTEPLDPEVADSANALLNYDKDTKQASVTISFTDEKAFENAWKLTSSTACELILYRLSRLADIESVSFNTGTNTVSWTGSEMADFDKLSIAAIAEDGTMYPLYSTEDSNVIASGSAVVTFPEAVPTGTYTIQISARDEEGNVNDVEESESKWNYVNPLQPANPAVSNVRLGGDYTIDVDVQAKGNVEYTGYTTVIEEYDAVTGEWVESEFAQQEFGKDAATLAVGGSFTSTNFVRKAASEDEEDEIISYSDYLGMTEEEKKAVTVVTEETGLEAGVQYRVKVNAYVITDNAEILYSEDQYTDPVTMVEPDPADVTVTGVNAVALEEKNSMGETVTRDVYTSNTVTLNLTADMAAEVRWELDNSSATGNGTIPADGKLTVELPALDQGEHVLKLRTTNERGDEATEHYTFRVDSEAPAIMISSPQTGSFYKNTVTVTGISEPGATIRVKLDGVTYAVVEVPETVHKKDADGHVEIVEGGHFTVDVDMDKSIYEQTISVTAEDAAGNVSRQYDLILVNDIVGKLDAELAIYLNGQDVTGQIITAGSAGNLELRYVQRDENGAPIVSVAVPASSNQGSQAFWDAYIVAGTGSVKRDNEGIHLETSDDVNGMLTVTVDKQQVSAILGGNRDGVKELYAIILPQDPEGYTVTTDDPLKISAGKSFTFKVTVNEGYDGSNMKVFANNMELTGVDGVYTINSIYADMQISVVGVVDNTAPELSVQVDTNTWREFLNDITFGLFFNKTEEAIITASDAGSGIASVSYVVSQTPIPLDQIADADWMPYLMRLRLDADGEYIIYARAVDNAGNVRYVSSDGLVIDSTVPGVIGIDDGGTYYDEVTFVVNEKNLQSIRVNGVQVEGTEITLLPDRNDQVIVVTDKAGNEVRLTVKVTKKFTITVPAEPEGYTVTASAETVLLGESYTFTVQVDEEYDATAMIVKVNGVEIQPTDGVYTVSDVDADQVITVEGVTDITAPELSVKVETNIWSEFLEEITFGVFFNKTETAEITASDKGSGLYGVYYVITANPISLDDLANASWTEYTEALELDADGNYIVYAKAVDNAGNVCYANSNGLVIDTVLPSVDGIEDGGVYTGDVTFTVTDENVESVMINGEKVEGEIFTVKPAEGQQTIVITDKAGNQITLTITVNPVPDPEPPVCDGKDDCPSQAFPDLDSSAWYHVSTDYVIEKGMMQGYDDGTFRPAAILNRAMMVQVLYNLEGKPAVTGTDSFTDTDEGSWYADAVLWGTKNGLIQGYGNGLFGPGDPLTREQMATIFYRYSELKGYTLTEGNYDHFSDKDAVSGFAQSAMRWAVGNGLMVGMGDGTLSPGGYHNRAEFATVIQRFLETIAK